MSDLISREEAKEALRERFKRIPTYAIWAMHIIDELPTHTTPSNTLGALDCVDRAEVIKAVKFYETFCDPYPRVIEALEELPSVQPDVPDTNVGDLISRQDAIDAEGDKWN